MFSPDEDMDEVGDEDDEATKRFRETCMEERRAGLARYRAALGKVLASG